MVDAGLPAVADEMAVLHDGLPEIDVHRVARRALRLVFLPRSVPAQPCGADPEPRDAQHGVVMPVGDEHRRGEVDLLDPRGVVIHRRGRRADDDAVDETAGQASRIVPEKPFKHETAHAVGQRRDRQPCRRGAADVAQLGRTSPGTGPASRASRSGKRPFPEGHVNRIGIFVLASAKP